MTRWCRRRTAASWRSASPAPSLSSSRGGATPSTSSSRRRATAPSWSSSGATARLPCSARQEGEMRDIVMRALDTARQRGAAYADARVVRRVSESITVRNENVEGLTADETLGFGVRVIVDGYWGFASSYKLALEEA